jgi:hypothetical protein
MTINMMFIRNAFKNLLAEGGQVGTLTRSSGGVLPYPNAGVAVVNEGASVLTKTVITFNNYVMPITHGTGLDGFGTVTLGAFPRSEIRRFGTVVDSLTVTTDGANITGTSDLLLGMGYATQTAGIGIVSNGAIFASNGSGITVSLIGGTATFSNFGSTNSAVIDGIGTARLLTLNVAGVKTTANATITLNGVIRFVW